MSLSLREPVIPNAGYFSFIEKPESIVEASLAFTSPQ